MTMMLEHGFDDLPEGRYMVSEIMRFSGDYEKLHVTKMDTEGVLKTSFVYTRLSGLCIGDTFKIIKKTFPYTTGIRLVREQLSNENSTPKPKSKTRLSVVK